MNEGKYQVQQAVIAAGHADRANQVREHGRPGISPEGHLVNAADHADEFSAETRRIDG